MSQELSSRNWLGKASAGLVLGLGIALGLSGWLFVALGLGGDPFSLPAQFAMWFIAPAWCLVLSLCFLFATGLRAWLWLGAACAAVWAIYFAIGGLA